MVPGITPQRIKIHCSNIGAISYGAVASMTNGQQPKFRDTQLFEVRILGNNHAQSEAVERAICDHLTRV